MKLEKMPDLFMRAESTENLEKILLDRVVKLRKLNKEMKENVHVQKAEDSLSKAKAPFKRARASWIAEIEALEVELRGRNIKFSIQFDDIFKEGDFE